MEDTRSYHVSMGDGQRKRTQGYCTKVVLQLGGAEITEYFYVLELGGVDVILRVDWLAKLGEVVTD